jgi:solute:Na+ symporter, SSS family
MTIPQAIEAHAIPFLILAYLGGLVAYGAWHSRKISSQADFAVAGRRLGVFVLVGTMLATWIGTGSLIGNAEKTYRVGIAMTLVPIGSVLGLAILSTVATRIRRFESLTVQDIIEKRFGLLPRVLATVAIISAYLIIVSYQYRAGGGVIHTIFPQLAAWCEATLPATLVTWLYANFAWNPSSWGSIIAAVFIIGYTVLGGLMSVAYTDVINGIVMVLGIAIGVPWLISELSASGGWEALETAQPSHFQFFGPITAIDAVNYILPATLLIMGEANLYQRFFAARSAGAAGRAGLVLIATVAVVEVGIILLAFASWAVEPSLPQADRSHVILIAAQRHFPVIVAAMVMGAAVAIIVSTADSFLLVSSNSFVRDVMQRFVTPDASERQLVLLSRLVVVFLGLLAFGISVFSDKFFEVALWAYTIYGASVTPVLMATFFWRRATTAGAAAGLLGGLTTTIVWELAGDDWAGWWSLLASALGDPAWMTTLRMFDAVLPAMLVAVTLLVVVSLLTPPPRPEQWRPFVAEST